MFAEKCPTCGTICNCEWHGLELVENSGDETLATKGYTPQPTFTREDMVEFAIYCILNEYQAKPCSYLLDKWINQKEKS